MNTRYTEEEIIDHLQYWLFNIGRQAKHLGELCQLLMAEFKELDIQIDRLNLGIFVMHPELAGLAYQLTPDDPYPTAITVNHSSLEAPIYLNSPIRIVVEDKVPHRWVLKDEAQLELPFLQELKARGFTDYMSMPLLGTHNRVHVLSLATKHPDGFYDDVYHSLCFFSHILAMLADSLTTQQLADVLLQLYVGRKTGPRVLEGEVQLGKGQTIRAAMLYSDMRGFSELCSTIGAAATIDVLNQYLSIVCAVIQEEGGEILKFMGDAIMAIFPVESYSGSAAYQRLLDTSAADACLRAARKANQSVLDWSAKNPDLPIRAGFGLSLGEVFYGNIGAPGRLDFTVIGDAVNLAARLETLCKAHQRDILIGPAFQKACHAPLFHLGKQQIKGFPKALSIYSLRQTPAPNLA